MADWIPLTRAALPASHERVVAVRAGEAVTHARFARDVACWQASFAAVPGPRVALFFDDGYDFAAALFGALHAGKQPVLPGDVQPATVARLLPQVDACAGELPGALQPAAAPASGLRELDLRESRLVIYTSGSSGQPLAIHKTLAQLDAEIQHLEAVFGRRLHPDALVFSTVSHQHIYGLLFVTLWPLASGRRVAVEKLVYPEQMAERLARQPSVLVSSPAHLKRIPDTLDWAPARAQLQAIFSSGGPLPPESAQQAHALLAQSPIEVYGSSETGGVAWRQRAFDGDAWTPLPGVQWKLKDDTLCVQSKHLEGDDWWETSDRARALEGGRFLLQGRADRIAKIEEKRVSLVALEEALVATGELLEAKALLVPEDGGARLGVVAVPSEHGWATLRAGGKRALNETLRRELLKGFERVVLPRRFRYVRELPVNSQGKATEALLTALFQPELPPVRWERRDAAQALAVLDIRADLRVLDGHFPGAPLLPGVAQLDWVARFGREAFAVPKTFLRAEQLKFQSPVLPGTALQLHLEWNAATGQLAFRYVSASGTHASGRLVFGSGDA
jgi:acyl-CoA synthetase (AMP-forming)/AMP-acid ligase II